MEINTAQDTETKILKSAENEFMEKGFEGARTTSIAEKAGVTHAMLHYYFRTKEKLFDRVIKDKIEALKNLLSETINDLNLSLEEMIRNIINRHLDFIAANPMLPRFIIRELSTRTERSAIILDSFREFSLPFIKTLQKKIDQATDDGICREADARTLILDIASLNLFSFLALPILNSALDNYISDMDEFIARRKKDNYETIMRKLFIAL